MTKTTTRSWSLSGLLLLAACAGGVPASQAQIELATTRLLAPYVAGGEVGCQELLVEVSPNLVVNVSQPTVDVKLHHAYKEPGDGYVDTVWTNRLGDLAGLFVVTIGETDRFTDQGHLLGRGMKFTVTNQVRLRVYSKGPMRLDTTAKGDVLVYKPTDATETDLHEFQIRDGALHRR
jgi:hypothetical protein